MLIGVVVFLSLLLLLHGTPALIGAGILGLTASAVFIKQQNQ
jgi:hypothetical protein